jgi:hypothetical protein
LLLLHDKFFLYIFESSNTANDSSFDLSLQFNGYPIVEELNCKKIAAFTAIEKRISLKVKKEIVAFHLNNNPFINSWLVQNRLTIGTICQF